ncbi:FecR family protein [Thermotomaculum hydrothermale]|nr:FecR family protein [Thermotomaculum hydrothermale]
MKKAILILMLLTIPLIMFADTSNNEENLYGIGVSFARLADVEGSVNVYRDSYQLEKADKNLPLNPLDVVKTAPDSRAVIQFIDGTLLKIGEDTKVEFLEIDGNKSSFAMIVRLWSGKVYYDVSDSEEFGDRTFRIDTKDSTIFILQHGQYRIDKNSFETDVKVVSGKVEIDVNDGAKLVRSGEAAIVTNDGNIQTFIFNTFDNDDFDLWAANSYKRKVVVSEKYVPREIKHYVYELDSYGTWVYDDTVEVYVWRPYIVETDWVPYSYGRWVWSPFGMTWVSYYPWGYAPFHYGYWNFSVSFGWVWVPDVWYSPGWVTWTYWDSYVGWYPCTYYRGRVVRYPVRYRRVVYAPVDRFYRRGVRYRTSPLPANRRIVQVRNPILPDPVALRRNPRDAVVRALRKPVTREVINRRVVEIRKRVNSNISHERVTTIGGVRNRTVITERGNVNSGKRVISTERNRVIRNRGSSSNSRVIRGNSPVIKNDKRDNSRTIRAKPQVIRNERTIERNNFNRNSTPVYRQNKVIERNTSERSTTPVYRQNRTIQNRSTSGIPTYRQRTIGEKKYTIPRTNDRTIINKNRNSSMGSKTYSGKSRSYSRSSRGYSSKTKSYSSGSHSRSIRITPKSYSPRSYSPRSYSGGSRRTIRRR